MALGGKRAGAGRKPGKKSATTLLRMDSLRALQDGGVTPLTVMLMTMRALWEKATEVEGQLDTKLAERAAALAKDAAPFIHPKLANVEMKQAGNVKVTRAIFVMSQDGQVVKKMPMEPEAALIEPEGEKAPEST